MIVGVDKDVLNRVLNILERDSLADPIRAEILGKLQSSCTEVPQEKELQEWMRMVHDPKVDLGNRLQSLSISLGRYVEQPTFEDDAKFNAAVENHPTVLQMLERVIPHIEGVVTATWSTVLQVSKEAKEFAAKARERQLEKQAIVGYLIESNHGEVYFTERLVEALSASMINNTPLVPLTRLGAVLNEGIKVSIKNVVGLGTNVEVTNTLSGEVIVLSHDVHRIEAVETAHKWAAFFGVEFVDK